MFINYNLEYRYHLGGKMKLNTSLTYRQFYSEGLFEEIEQFINLMDVCDVPVYFTLGNHDISSYNINTEEKVSSNE